MLSLECVGLDIELKLAYSFNFYFIIKSRNTVWVNIHFFFNRDNQNKITTEYREYFLEKFNNTTKKIFLQLSNNCFNVQLIFRDTLTKIGRKMVFQIYPKMKNLIKILMAVTLTESLIYYYL